MNRKITATDVMSTALITAKPDDKIDATDVDMKLAEIRHLPIIDDAGKLVGIVSNRDLARALSKRNHKTVTVSEVMSWDVETAVRETPVTEIIETMLAQKIGCLPILDGDGGLVGIVTETDCLQVALTYLQGGPAEEATGYHR